MSNVSATRKPWTPARYCRAVAVVGIALIAVMRCVIVFAPQVYFDVDPAVDPAPLAAMGKVGSLALDVVLLAFVAIGLFALRGRMQWSLFVLALLPLPIVVFHGWHDAGDLWRGVTWVAAALAAVTVAHLTRERELRLVFAALLLAVIAPLLVRGIGQVTFEHAQTVSDFEQQREAFFADRGWEPDSPAAQIYERRLRHPQPFGWFSTTNILASLMTAAAIVLVGCATGAWRAKLPRGWIVITALFAALCAAAVYLSGSRGAMLTLVAGLALCVVPLAASRAFALQVRFASIIFLVVIALGLVGVIIRGTLLPESFASEKSLLFRWHYMVSSAEMFAASPVLGVGPDGFQDAYMQHRLPRNPEEVISAHSVFIDWLVTLGVLAIAWAGLVCVLIYRAGRALGDDWQPLSEATYAELTRWGGWAGGAVAVIALGGGMFVEAHVLDTTSQMLRMIGALGYAGLVWVLLSLLVRLEWRVLNWSIAAAACALALHGQIEMTFFLHGSVVWVMCMIGLAAGCCVTQPHQSAPQRGSLAVGLLIMVFAGWIVFAAILPGASQNREVRNAVTTIVPVAENRQEQALQRQRAAGHLLAGYERWPSHDAPLRDAVRQLQRAAQLALDADHRTALLTEAIVLADRLVADHGGYQSLMIRSRLSAMRAQMLDESNAWDDAIEDAQQAAALDRNSNLAQAMLGDVLWAAGRYEQAREAYSRALHADDQFELDPLKQFPQRRREEIEQRIAEPSGE